MWPKKSNQSENVRVRQLEIRRRGVADFSLKGKKCGLIVLLSPAVLSESFVLWLKESSPLIELHWWAPDELVRRKSQRNNWMFIYIWTCAFASLSLSLSLLEKRKHTNLEFFSPFPFSNLFRWRQRTFLTLESWSWWCNQLSLSGILLITFACLSVWVVSSRPLVDRSHLCVSVIFHLTELEHRHFLVDFSVFVRRASNARDCFLDHLAHCIPIERRFVSIWSQILFTSRRIAACWGDVIATPPSPSTSAVSDPLTKCAATKKAV